MALASPTVATRGAEGHRPGFEVADVVRAYGESFTKGHPTGRHQRAVLRAIARCRTAALGGHVERCEGCGHHRIAYNSCRNRHCPKCQGSERAAWLEERAAELADRRQNNRAAGEFEQGLSAGDQHRGAGRSIRVSSARAFAGRTRDALAAGLTSPPAPSPVRRGEL